MIEKASSVKCVRDLRDFTPSDYRLPSDGRKTKKQCELRRALAMELALYANGDGSSIKLSVQTLADHLGKSVRTIKYVLDDLSELGLLENGKLCGFKKPRARALNISAFKANLAQVQDSIPQVQDSPNTSARLATAQVQDSPVFPPETPQSCTQPTLTDRPTTQPTDLTGLENGGMEVPLKTAPMAHSDIAMDDETEAVRSYEKFHWQRFMQNLPDVLQGATMQKGQRAEIEKLVAKHGADLLLAIITRWLEVRDMPLEGRRANKWGALLEEIEPHIYAVKKESRRKKKSAIDWAATDAEIMRLAKEEQDARDARAVKFGNAGSNSGSVLDNL